MLGKPEIFGADGVSEAANSLLAKGNSRKETRPMIRQRRISVLTGAIVASGRPQVSDSGNLGGTASFRPTALAELEGHGKKRPGECGPQEAANEREQEETEYVPIEQPRKKRRIGRKERLGLTFRSRIDDGSEREIAAKRALQSGHHPPPTLREGQWSTAECRLVPPAYGTGAHRGVGAGGGDGGATHF